MPYKRSVYRDEFDTLNTFLVRQAVVAHSLDPAFAHIRDMVFQCAIFQTSAALETYIRLIIENWAQETHSANLTNLFHDNTRYFIVQNALKDPFSKFFYDEDEKTLLNQMSKKTVLWQFSAKSNVTPTGFKPSIIYEKKTYPSFKNMKRLFYRMGIDNFVGYVSSHIKTDFELALDSFQSIRTAVAHSTPQALTLTDVKHQLGRIRAIVAAIDRLLWSHFRKHGSPNCWK